MGTGARPGISPHISITGAPVNGANVPFSNGTARFCKISVQDNGRGFSPEYNEQIFGLFQRLHANAEFTGSGLGLSICKKIVENHHGVITAMGDPEKGATFDIYLPVG